MATNQYLTGNFAPVADEITATDLPVQGAVPPELSGRFLRIGPNPITPPDPATHHWFAGRILSLTEMSIPYELTPELETVRRTDFGGHDFGSEVARIELPVRVPYGFHGNWIADP